MSNFDFSTVVPRRGTNSYKWDSSSDPASLPMWVADMDFRTAPAIINALQQRVAHGIFGYTKVPDSYYSAVVSWFARRHNWTIDPHWIIYTSGVVPALSAIIKATTKPGDKVIVQTPAYNCFFSSIRNNECQLLPNNLIYSNGHYSIDFSDLEAKAADPRAKLLLLCNPHNPSGRVWTATELRRIGDICIKNGLLVVADEIHCELTYDGHDYTPFASLGTEYLHNSVTCVSPSKGFNLAGLQIANIIASNDSLRRRIDRAININEVCDVNPFGVIALTTAYNDCAPWLDALRKYLWGNYQHLCQFFRTNLPDYHILPLEGTYLAWIDCRASGLSSDDLTQRLQSQGHLIVNSGTLYGSGGEGFIRLNIACPLATLNDGLKRIALVLKDI